MVTSAVRLVIFVTVISHVTGWTIDLPEVRRYYFEKYDTGRHEDSKNDSDANNNGTTFDNINADSLHNKNEQYDHYYPLHKNHGVNNDAEDNTYAKSYNQYESYMVRKVQDTLHNGTAYLDGLRLSIERYIQLLENCSRLNFTENFPPELTSPLSTGSSSGFRDSMRTCREATKTSEHLRRLAELALHTTRRLQDVALTSKYNKEDSLEENELLLRLAWYLDKLAHLTGYEPEPRAVTSTKKPPSLATSLGFALPELSPSQKAAILNCLRANSTAPATERCAVNVPQPGLTRAVQTLNFSESTFFLNTPLPTRVSRQSSDDIQLRPNDDTSPPSLEPELLLATDNKNFPPKRIQRRSTDSVENKIPPKERSVTDSENPLVKVLKYYAKHKTWTNSNPVSENSDLTYEAEPFDVKNRLHFKRKRSVDPSTKINKIPEDPMPDLSKYVKSNPNLRYIVDRNAAADQLKAVLEAIHTKKLLSNNQITRLSKFFRQKRSVPVEHVRETIKTDTDILYDIPKDLTDKIKSALHHIPVAISHIPPLIEHHALRGHIDHHQHLHQLHEHKHHEHLEHLKHLAHVEHHGHVEHVTKNIDYHYDHKEDPAEKIKAALHHLHAKKVQIAKKIETIRKIFRPKRSTHYEGVINPRISEDPQQDISYYLKNREGTNYNRDLAQAALLRLSLEAAFQRGDINVVHKYGANYNPLVVAPFYAGILRSLADSY